MFVAILSLIWFIGTCIRVYQQARFFQIEEYMSLRYLRWLVANRPWFLPVRGLTAAVGGGLVGLFVADTTVLAFVLLAAAAGVGVYPQPPGEIKKGFNRTQRATRLLAAAWGLALVGALLGAWAAWRIPSGVVAVVTAHALGALVWWLGPLWLVGGNLIMAPVEASIRQGFKRQARRRLDEVKPTVIGITGSYGKTSTKTYIAHLLNGKYHAFPTPKSWNTLMGVCLAINTRMDDHADYFICEMGAYVRGEIQAISALTHPGISVVTEVGPQHLERFGSLQNIATAKYEIIKALPPDGLGVFNWDNPYVREMYERGYPANRIAISRQADPANPPPDGPRLIASGESETLDGLTFNVLDVQTGHTAHFETALVGQHNVTNILLAAAIALHEGLTLDHVAQRVRTLQPAEARLVRQVLPNGMTIINDAYSANPVGAVSALRVLGMHDTGRRLLITPGMVELGEMHETENKKLGEAAANYATDVILVGPQQTRPIRAGLEQAGFPPANLMVMDTVTEAIAWYQQHLGAGDTVLFLNDLPDTY